MAKLANDGMAELIAKHPDRFLGFVASLPMNDPEGLLKEARRAVTELGAVGVQIFTNVLGRPLDKPETMPLFDLIVESTGPYGCTLPGARTSRTTKASRRATTRSGGP